MEEDELLQFPPHSSHLHPSVGIDHQSVPSNEEDEKNNNVQVSKNHDPRVSAKKCGIAYGLDCGKGFKNGDVIWAKAFAYSWWPGRVKEIKGSSASVSFYGCAKTRWVRVSEIRGFEESFAQMVKMGGARLSVAVGLALDDMQRTTTLGLICSCRNSTVEASEDLDGQIAEPTRRFEPSEMLGFLFDMAISAWVDEREIVRAVKMSAQVSTYRQHALICQNSEVDERFSPVDLLDFVTNMAVCWFINDRDTSSFPEAMVQLNGYRKFVSVCPSWGYQQTIELEHSFLSDESEDHYDMSDSSSDSEILVEVWKETEDDLLFDKQEEDFAVVEEQVQGGEICTVNRVDFSFLDLDEKYETLLDNQLEQAADSAESSCETICVIENLEKRNSSTGISFEEDIETTCNKGFSYISDVNQIADNCPCFNLDDQPMNFLSSCQTNSWCENTIDVLSDHKCAPSGEVIVYDGIPFDGSGMENLKQQDENITNFEHKKDMDSAAETVSSDKSSLLEIVPWVGNQLVINHLNNCRTHFPNKTMNDSLITQPSSELDLIVNPSGIVKRTASQSAFKRRRLDHPLSSNISLKSLEPHAETVANVVNKSERPTASHSDEFINEKSVAGKALMLSGSEGDVVPSANHSTISCRSKKIKDDMRVCSGKFLLKPANQTKFHQRKGHDLPISSDMSKWSMFYASPLVRDISKSSGNLRKPSLTDRYGGKQKTLHMKFPKDFNLPSREELEKKFGVFGPLDHSRTRVFFYTGAAQVVFVNHADAVAAHRYVKKKSAFGQANVRFWFDEHESSRKGQTYDDLSIQTGERSSLLLKSCFQVPDALPVSNKTKSCSINSRNVADDFSLHMEGHSSSHLKSHLQLPGTLHISDKKKSFSINSKNISVPTFNNSSLNLKSCLRSPDAPHGRNTKCKVRFTIET